MAQYPFGAVGQFAVGSVPVFGAAVDLPIPSAKATASTPAGTIVVGVTLDIPAKSAIASAPIPTIVVGITLDIPAKSAVASAPIPEIVQSANILVPSSVAVASAPIPSVDAGVSIIVNSEITMFVQTGPPGFVAVGLYAVGSGPSISRIVFVVPKAVAGTPLPFVDAGASVVVGIGANSNSPVSEIDARRRKLRILAIAS